MVWNCFCIIIKYFLYFFVPGDYYISPKIALAEKEARHLRWFQEEREKRIEQRGTYLCNILSIRRPEGSTNQAFSNFEL